MKKIWMIVSLVLVVMVSGCGSSESPSSKMYGGNSDMAEPAMVSVERDAAGDMAYSNDMAMDEKAQLEFNESLTGEEEKYADGGSGETQVAYERKIIKTGFVYMETLEYETTIKDISSLLNKYNAYTAYSENNSGSIYEKGYQARFSRYTIKVPAEMFEEMYEELQTVGHVLNQNEGKRDVTADFIDIEARLTTLKVQEERLLAILERTEVLEDVIELEYALQDTRYEIERYTTNLRNLEDQVRFSTIELSVQEVYEPTVIEEPVVTFGDRIAKGLEDTFNEISRGFQNFIIFIVTQFPYLIFTAIVLYVFYREVKRLANQSTMTTATKGVLEKQIESESKVKDQEEIKK